MLFTKLNKKERIKCVTRPFSVSILTGIKITHLNVTHDIKE
jgi:hypothetical protein